MSQLKKKIFKPCALATFCVHTFMHYSHKEVTYNLGTGPPRRSYLELYNVEISRAGESEFLGIV